MAERAYTISEGLLHELVPMLRWWRRRGPDRIGPNRTSIDVGFPGVRWFKPVGWTLISANKWEYTLQAIDDETFEVTGLNQMEADNDASIAGPGINLDNLPDGFSLVPVGKDAAGNQVECVFPAWKKGDEWWFCVENAIDGECAEGGGGGGGGGFPEQLAWMGIN